MTTNKLYVFVKGRAGRCAYEISDPQFNPLYDQVVEPLLNENGEKLSPYHTDLKPIEACV